MKFIKILPFFLSLIILISPLFSQENGVNADDISASSEKSDQLDKKTADILSAVEGKLTDTPAESGSGENDVDAAGALKKEQDKIRVIKKTAQKTETKVSQAETEKIPQKLPDDDSALLRVDEGNFKYTRIPEIAINDTKPSYAAVETRSEEISPDDKKPDEGGFLGMKKETADVVAKGGILLLILVIFILYKSRTKGTRKSGPGRNVLNSYRK